jgi:tetratricopeptide (TPR) repeat protein
VQARELVAVHPGSDEAQALLGAVLADVGRDSEARRQLDRLDLASCSPAAAVLAAEIAAVLQLPGPAEALYERLFSHDGRHAGLLCHVLDRWAEAERHFEHALVAYEPAPVLAAHTRRHYSAMLRARGDDGDWERAIALLGDAADVYRRLEIDRLADDADAILRRSAELDADSGGNVFRRVDDGWALAFGGGEPTVAEDDPGLGYVATLLAAAGRPVHAVDLVGGPGVVDLEVRAAYRARLDELDGATDPLALAERDLLAAGPPGPADPVDRARRLVALRIRTGLDRVEPALPALARHLRGSLRTGTFCVYEPASARGWRMGP